MKKLFTLFAIGTCFAAQAQITLNQSSFAGWIPDDQSIRDNQPTTAAIGANTTWDYASLGSTGTTQYGYYPAADQDFTTATFGSDIQYKFSALGYVSYAYGAVTANGIQRFGEKLQRQAIPIGTLTGNANDSLVFLQQTVVYTSPRNLLSLPATMNSTGSSNYSFSTAFELTATPFGLNDAPCVRRTYVKINDTVKGWGKMRVLDMVDDTSGYMNVLAVQSHVENTDSFFLNGNPAPPSMLAAFGLTQGMITKAYRIRWFRAGEVESLMLATYTDGTYTTQSANESHMDRLATPTKVSELVAVSNMVLYPNPVVNGTINLSMDNVLPGVPCTYELYNVAGQKMATNTMYVNGGNASIKVDGTATGIHYLRVYQQGQLLATAQVLLQP